MCILIFAGVFVCFFLLQSVLTDKIRNPAIKNAPFGFCAACILLSAAIYALEALLPHSQGVREENLFFARALTLYISIALTGCISSKALAKTRRVKK